MAYQIFLLDGVEYTELDTEDVDMDSIYSISDINDIAARKDAVKTITFKGTKNNNYAFGSLFHLNRQVDFGDASTYTITENVIFLDSGAFGVNAIVLNTVPQYYDTIIGKTIAVSNSVAGNNGNYDVIATGTTVILGHTKDYLQVTQSVVNAGETVDLTIPIGTTIANRLFFNYSPLRTVECLIYENNILIFKGSLRVNEVDVDKYGVVTYQTVVTGGFIDFRNAIQNLYLADLDFSDLTHHYCMSAITTSWSVSTERYNGNNYYNAPFKMGESYIYPHIDYGNVFHVSSGNTTPTIFNAKNYRPAIYVREYFNRIFSQPELTGFTYEIKGDTTFVDNFNSLIIPNADERLQRKLSGFTQAYTYSSSEDQTGASLKPQGIDDLSNGELAKLLTFDTFPTLPPNTINSFISQYKTYDNVLFIDRTISSNGTASITFDNLHNPYAYNFNVALQLVTRDEINNADPYDSWEVVAQNSFTILSATTVSNVTLTVDIPEVTLEQNKQLALRLDITSDISIELDFITFSISDTLLKFPADNTSQIYVELQLANGITGGVDLITPHPPEGIKQIDFLKSILHLFNLYAYTEITDHKHIIFERYNDFYALASPVNLSHNALNWSGKIDYSQGLQIKSNLDLPKSYVFTFKEDSDYFNNQYKTKYTDVYGTFRFTDTYGLIDEKKVELIFSPSPLVKYNGDDKLFPAIYAVESGNKKPAKSNIRILYYNGIKNCAFYNASIDYYSSGGTWSLISPATPTIYPRITNYTFDSIRDLPVEDLYFGLPRETYFPFSQPYVDATNSYQNFYTNQTSELTNANVVYVQCKILLNEVDINNLSLKVPIFIQTENLGYAYFKVLSVEYSSSNVPSTVLLQKIIV